MKAFAFRNTKFRKADSELVWRFSHEMTVDYKQDCIHSCMYVCKYVWKYACKYGWMDGWMHTCMSVCMYVCMHYTFFQFWIFLN